MSGGQVLLTLLLLAGVRVGGASWPFLEEPTNQSAVLGGEAELRCAVRGGGAVQWARGGLLLGTPPSPAHPRYRLAGDPRKGEHHLRVGGVTLEDDDVFECQVGEGNGTRASRPAQLTVLVPPGPPRLELPEGAELPWVGGAEMTIRCHVPDARPPARVEITLGGVPVADVTTRILEGSHPKLSSSEATARLTPRGPAPLGCAGSNAAGEGREERVLRLRVPPSSPTIEGLDSPHVRVGETLRLVCVVRGGDPPPSLHWEKDGSLLPGSWVTEGDPGVSRSHVTLTVTSEDDGSTLRCHVTSPIPPPAGDTASVTLRVTYPPSEVTIVGTPEVPENGSVTLGCTSSPSNPPVRLRWWLGGLEVTPGESRTSPAEGRGWVTSSNVTLWGRSQDHGRPLVCEAETPGLGTRSASVVLSVIHPPLALWLEAPPPNVTFRAGTRVRLNCHARGGHPPPRLSWAKDGRPIKEGSQSSGGGTPASGGGPRSSGGLVTRELLLTLSAGDNGATYTCLGGTPPRRARHRLRVLFPPQAVTVSAAPPEPRPGQTVTLTCRAGSARPSPTLRWLRGGHPLPGEPLPEAPAPHGGVSVGSRLRLPVTIGDHGQRVTCEATSAQLGVTVSAAHTLQLLYAPQFVEGDGALVVAREHQSVQLPIKVLANPPVETCTWTLEGQPLLLGSRGAVAAGGSLLLGSVSRGDGGSYSVECRNRAGSGRARLRLTVLHPPAIVRVPDPVLVTEGEDAELECEVTGEPLPPGSLAWSRMVPEEGGSQPLPPQLLPGGSLPVGRLRVLGARRELGGPYECHVDTGVAPPARAVVHLVVRYGPELEAEPGEGAGPGAGPGLVLVPDRAEETTLRCRAQGVPGVTLNWEHQGHPLAPEDPRFQEHQWREGPWTSSILRVGNISQDRARLRHQFHHPNWDQYKSPPRYQYKNWDQSRNRDQERNRSLGTFVCVAQNQLGTVRRQLQLQLADRPDPPRELRVVGVTPRSLSLAWTPGFHGGLAQTFLLSAKAPEAPPPPVVLLASGSALTLEGLLPATPYDVTVRARNARGDSAAVVIRAVTSALPGDLFPPMKGEEEAPPPTGFALPLPPLLGGVLGGLVLVGGAGCCWRRHFREKEGGNRKEEGGNRKEDPGVRGLELSSLGSWVTPSDPPEWDPAPGDLHLYEDVEEWGEVPPPALRFTPQGELV